MTTQALAAPYDTRLAPYGLTLLRVSLGTMWIAHALLKYFVFTLPGTAGFFQSVGFPGWMAYPVFAAELLGGTAILLGIYARQVSALMVPVMLGAASVHFGNGWVFSSPNGGWEYPIFLTAMSVVLALTGDGAWTLKSRSRLI